MAMGYDYIADVKEGEYVDAEDSVKNWCVAKVLEKDDAREELSLHFDGWHEKYDEVIEIKSSRIEPFRLITNGYTGMTKTTRRDGWKYHYGDLETLKRKVEDTLEADFENLKSAHEATQFLRGELFFYVDGYLANWKSSDEDADYRDVIEFMHVVFKLIIRWMDIFPKKYMKYYEIHKRSKQEYLVDKDVAIAASGYELIKILDHCFKRHDRIYKVTKLVELTDAENETDWYYSKKKEHRYKIALCHSFGSQGGFESIITFCNAVPEETEEEHYIPLMFVNLLLDSISDIIADFKSIEHKEALLTDIKKIIIAAVENITDDEIEKLETSQINDLVEKLKFFGGLSENSDKKMEETLELTLCHKLLR